MNSDIKEITYTADDIRACVMSLAKRLEADYRDKNPVFIGVLKGSFMFLADLVRYCSFPLEIRFLSAASYGDASVTSGEVTVSKLEELSLTGRHVVIVEDILDSGHTLRRIRETLLQHSPASLRICAFLDKTECRRVEIEADYAGFVCPSEFLVGYGLDYAERYRNLPYIGVLKPEVYGA